MAQTNLKVKYIGLNKDGKQTFAVTRTCDEVVFNITESKNGDGYRLFYNDALGYQASTNLTAEIIEQTQLGDGWIVSDGKGNPKIFEFMVDPVAQSNKKMAQVATTGVNLDGEVMKVFKTLLKLNNEKITLDAELDLVELLDLLKAKALENYENFKEDYEDQVLLEKIEEKERLAQAAKAAILERQAQRRAEREKTEEKDGE